MAKFFIVYGLEFLIGLALITQVVIPIFVPKLKFFWLFRSNEKTQTSNTTLDDLKSESERNKQERTKIKDIASEAERVLKDIKGNTD